MTSKLATVGNQNVDMIVEKMFSDIFNETYGEDEITLQNFNIYMDALYKFPDALADLDDSDELLRLAVRVFSKVIVHEIEDTDGACRYGVRFEHWPSMAYASHGRLSNALALAIIQDMRYTTSAHLNKPDQSSKH